MKILRLTKVVIPDLVAYIRHGNEKLPDYRCPECGYGIGEDYTYCPYCGVKFNWEKMNKPSKEFKKLIDKL